MTPDSLSQWLLPYDARQMALAVGPGVKVALPPIRCTDDRRMVPQLRLPIVEGGLLAGWRAEGHDLSGIITGQIAWTIEGMAQNAMRTGTSITAGLSGAVAAHLVGLMMGGFDPVHPTTVYLQVMNFLTVIPHLGRDHQECAGLANLLPIYQAAASQPEQVLETTLLLAPLVDQTLHGLFTDAVRRFVGRPELFSPPGQTPSMPRLLLGEGTPHGADYLVAIQQQSGAHVLWDTEAAWLADRPGYAQNVGLFRLVAEILTIALGGNADHVEAAMLYFVGASIPFLPRPQQDVPLAILRA